ncbi:MAG: glycerol kinase [Alphaproteobacteria bacterium]|nr:glycerol kinase [Alphaproteobacteria bacterium]|tara:strand:- start:524367 stop:525854 length:1488 start_codon:yes stop_codon:yes gene_type:complete
MSKKAIIAIDQGTTSSRSIAFSEDGAILALAQKELTLHYPNKGWVEQNANDIWQDTLWALKDVIAQAEGQGYEAAVIGITNQRETTIIWDRNTGKPIYNAIVWQDRRTAEYCQKLKDTGAEADITEKTGLLLDPYFSASKVAWILDHVDGARAKADAGQLAFGTVDSFILWHLTGGDVHATDATNASRTMLMNIQTGAWDDDLLALFNIPRSLLPEIRDNIGHFGDAAENVIGKTIAIGGIAGDQQAALIGQACFDTGMVKSTYGTGCFVLMNIGDEFKISKNKLLTTVAYQIDGQITYALEGSIFVAGAAIQWLRDNAEFFAHASESEALALSVSDNNGVYFVPAFTGLGAPYWAPDAKAAILGLSRESNKAHITRAALEAQAYQTQDLMSAFAADSGVDIGTLRCDGGLVANNFVCQYLADILNKAVELPEVTETTALGAAYLAGVYAGIYSGLDDVAARWACAKSYSPSIMADKRQVALDGWAQAVGKVLYT